MTSADTSALERALQECTARYSGANPLSRQAHERARRILPGGHTRQTLYHEPFPLVIRAGTAAHLTDLDGHEYVNMQGDYTAGLYGHSCAPVRRAIVDATQQQGLSLGGVTAKEAELAGLITSRIRSIEQVRFCHSGSEACLFSILLARHATKRPGIFVFKGAYHGGFLIFGEEDSALNVPFATVKGVFNDTEGTRSLLRQHAASLAAVIVEPVLGSGGCIPARAEFLQMLRSETQRLGMLLILDEVMTSRLAPGGAQELYDIRPDVTTLGKYWGGGFGFGAFGGSQSLMRHLDTSMGGLLSQAGTFNNNAVTMSAGVAGVSEVFTPEACVQLNRRGDQLRQEIATLARTRGVALQTSGMGSVLNTHWHMRPIVNAAAVESPNSTLRRLFHLEMLQSGIYTAPRGLIAMSLALAEDDIGSFLTAIDRYLTRYRDLLPRAA
jgi:glutamate-1-semialdehyde 2,1-aminomutase